MARAIVRYSINGESRNTTGNAARSALQEGGFEKIGTGSFEADGITMPGAISALADLLTVLLDPPGGGTVDHLWVYVDEPEPPN
jgi:hypothetical protein